MTKIITREQARAFDAFARARDNNPYTYGGAFTTNPNDSTDCSGLVLQTGAILSGRTDWSGNRYGSTESFRLDYKIVYDLGFKRLPAGGVTALGFQPVILVGLHHGGGGVYSHTACTLFYADTPGGEVKQSQRGIDWESSGTYGVQYYDNARPWNDSLFEDFWYLDANLDTAPPATGDDPISKFERWKKNATDRELLEAIIDQLGPGNPAWDPSLNGRWMREKVFGA